jgi:hypothetical protein
MSFSEHEKAQILRTSRQLLRDKDKPPGTPPAPEPPPIEIKFEDPLEKWKREADEADARREAARAAMRREERKEREAMTHARALGADAAARITALEGRMDEAERQISELSRAVSDFSDAVTGGFRSLEEQCAKLDTKLTELRALDDQHRVIDMPSPLRPRSVN